MAASPPYKVYSKADGYVASCKHAHDAAVLVGSLGDGSTIRYDHKLIVWIEGEESQRASESHATAARRITRRVRFAEFVLSHGAGKPTHEGYTVGEQLMGSGDDFATAAAEVAARGLTVK